MKLVSLKSILDRALEDSYAVGHFDIHNLEWTQAVLEAAQEENSPIILGVTEEAVQYFGGFSVPIELIKSLILEMSLTIPVVIHLDHGSSLENCKKAIDAGFTSVMIDASHYPLEENIKITKEVVTYAHKHDVTVEAEVGSIGGTEDGSMTIDPIYADIDECVRLVKQSRVDCLAPALGSVHGPYKGEPKLGFKEMEEIAKLTNVPLVLHGSSGLPEEQIKKAILSGTAKINVNADNHLAFTKSVRESLEKDADVYDARIYLSEGRKKVKETVKQKIRMFGSNGKG